MKRTGSDSPGARAALLAADGLLKNNPVFVQALGLCPTLAVSSSVFGGLGMGLSVTVVLILSNVLISLLKRLIPGSVRIAAYIVLISGLVSALQLVLKAYMPALDQSLGIFIPLITVNCLILARAESFASKNGMLESLLDGLFMGLGFAAAIFVLAALREVLGNGTFLNIKVTPGFFEPMEIFASPPGAFIVLGCAVAAFRAIIGAINRKS